MRNTHTILIDDDHILLFMLSKLIIKNGLHPAPMTFESAQDALDYLYENYNQTDIFTILLDINMPEVDGWDFLDKAKDVFDESNFLVFIVSSSINKFDKLKAETYPMVVSYLEKPIFEDKIQLIKEKVNEKMAM